VLTCVIQVHDKPDLVADRLEEPVLTALEHALERPQVVIHDLQSDGLGRIACPQHGWPVGASPPFVLEVSPGVGDRILEGLLTSGLPSTGESNPVLFRLVEQVPEQSLHEIVVDLVLRRLAAFRFPHLLCPTGQAALPAQGYLNLRLKLRQQLEHLTSHLWQVVPGVKADRRLALGRLHRGDPSEIRLREQMSPQALQHPPGPGRIGQ